MFCAVLTTQEEYSAPSFQALLRQAFTAADFHEVQVFEEDFHVWVPTKPAPANIASPEDWDNAFVGAGNMLRQVEQRLDGQTLQDATALHNRVQSQVLVEAGLLLSLVLVAVLGFIGFTQEDESLSARFQVTPPPQVKSG